MSKRKKKTKGLNYWKKKAWDEFSILRRLEFALETTGTKDQLICCTCGKQYPAFGVGCAQAGHFVPGRGNAILFDKRGVHGQCYNCNCRLKGNWPNYMAFMMNRYDREVVDELLRLNKTVRKFTIPELQEMREDFKEQIKIVERS